MHQHAMLTTSGKICSLPTMIYFMAYLYCYRTAGEFQRCIVKNLILKSGGPSASSLKHQIKETVCRRKLWISNRLAINFACKSYSNPPRIWILIKPRNYWRVNLQRSFHQTLRLYFLQDIENYFNVGKCAVASGLTLFEWRSCVSCFLL